VKCVVCGKDAMDWSVVCSERCASVRKLLFEVGDEYAPRSGCPNCWGDLYVGCTPECNAESERAARLFRSLWSLAHQCVEAGRSGTLPSTEEES